jgi:pyrroloquinoline quinone biosynthesis protein D
MSETSGASVPKLPRGVKLRFDQVRNRHMLLAPERAFGLDEAAVAVLELVDGERSVDDIVDTLAARFQEKREVIAVDVEAMLKDLAEKRVLEL